MMEPRLKVLALSVTRTLMTLKCTSVFRTLGRARCLDEQQPAKDERRQDTVDLARHKTTTEQVNNDRAGPVVCQGQILLNDGV